MLKKILFQLHWFLGITAGLVLSLMGVSGAIYSYDQQILKAINPQSYVVFAQQTPKLTPAQLYTTFEKQHVNNVTIFKDPTASSIINVKQEGNRKGRNIMVNPYTAEVLPEVKGQEFFKFILNFHRTLTMGEIGKQITGFCAFALIFFLLSGLYLRFPKKHSFKQWFLIKPKLKGRNFIWDLHAVIGTWVLIFYLNFALTGLFWSYDWWRSGMFSVLQVQRTPMQKEPSTPLLPLTQVQTDLNQAWQHTQFNYSSITLNVPQKNKVEISFVDPTPQHERAKNTSTFNVLTQRFENTKLYEQKGLNEKIMSSMLPVHRGSFYGPIWHVFAMLSALTMPLFFITGWMLYLKRRKPKIQKPTLKTAFDAPTWHVLYASQTGTAEQIAWQTTVQLQQAKQNVITQSLHKTTLEHLKHAQKVLFVVSTYGVGEPPDLSKNFVKTVLKEQVDLSHVEYAVLALGSHDYPETFCAFGHTLNTWLEGCGALPLFELIELNNKLWHESIAQVTHTQFQIPDQTPTFDTWELIHQEVLNPDSVGRPVYSIQLKTQNDELWQAGDIAQIQPENSNHAIIKFMQQHQIDPQQYNFLKDRQLEKNVPLNQLKPLPIREYSIASIPQQGYLQLVVRLHEFGLGSQWLCTYAKDTVHLRIRTNENFHLTEDNRPIILIGNGTGISGLLSLLESRIQKGYQQNWLFFGERQAQHDFFFKDKLLNWQNLGYLKLETAFSRDTQQYVQHKLLENAMTLQQWIRNDAIIYVCGSINGMATDVENTLIEILGQNTLDELRQTQRYRRDVY